MRGKYLSKQRLEELDHILAERDKAILRSLEHCRYLLTKQVGRLHFYDSATPTASLKAANRAMIKLRDYGLAETMERRIGGVRAGSGSYVWTVSGSGVFLLHLRDEDYTRRKRTFEPSPNFMKHTLEVAETYTQLTEICRRHSLEMTRAELEPVSWRKYTGSDGKLATMKPDLFAITDSGEYLDNWFIEVDMNTESPSVILEKCRRYIHYYRSGIEQKEHGVFPLVVWIVHNDSRKKKLQQYISDCREMSEKSKGIFTVILPGEFETLITGGIAALNEEKGEQIA